MANLGPYLLHARQTQKILRSSLYALKNFRPCSVSLKREVRCYSTTLEGKTVRIGCASGFWGDSATAGKETAQVIFICLISSCYQDILKLYYESYKLNDVLSIL